MAYGQQLMQKKRTSFTDALEVNSDMRQDIIDYLFRNYKITSYEEFQNALFNYFDSPHGANAMLTSDDAVILFNKPECKDAMKNVTTKEEFQDAYGNGDIITRVPISEKRVVTIEVPKVSVPSYTRQGRPVKHYSRGKANPFTPAQILFLKQRTGRPPRKIVSEYNAHFSANPRTPSSITTKVYRIAKSGKSSSKTFKQ